VGLTKKTISNQHRDVIPFLDLEGTVPPVVEAGGKSLPESWDGFCDAKWQMWMEALCGVYLLDGWIRCGSFGSIKSYISKFIFLSKGMERKIIISGQCSSHSSYLARKWCLPILVPPSACLLLQIHLSGVIVTLGTLYKLNPGLNDNFSRQTTEITQSLI